MHFWNTRKHGNTNRKSVNIHAGGGAAAHATCNRGRITVHRNSGDARVYGGGRYTPSRRRHRPKPNLSVNPSVDLNLKKCVCPTRVVERVCGGGDIKKGVWGCTKRVMGKGYKRRVQKRGYKKGDKNAWAQTCPNSFFGKKGLLANYSMTRNKEGCCCSETGFIENKKKSKKRVGRLVRVNQKKDENGQIDRTKA